MNKKADIVAQFWVIFKFNFLTGHCYFLNSFLVHGWVAFHTMPLWETLALWVHWISLRMVWNVPWNLYFHDHDAIFRAMLSFVFAHDTSPCMFTYWQSSLSFVKHSGWGRSKETFYHSLCLLGCARLSHLREVGLFSFSFLAGWGSEWIWWCQPFLKL